MAHNVATFHIFFFAFMCVLVRVEDLGVFQNLASVRDLIQNKKTRYLNR